MALSGTKALEAWCRKVTSEYENVKILNMTTSWRSGLAFCAIIHYHCPELIDFESLDPDDVYGNNHLAFSVAEQHLGIPSILDPQDMVECELLDRLSILTYLAQFFQAFSTPNSPIKANLIKGAISASSTSSDLNDATRTAQSKNPTIGKQSEPCKQCGKSVFILERLNVGGKIFHRTCFKCARCEEQLTLASFYETETGQFCCEVCPDEECKEHERTLKVNKDLARLMAGDSGESEDESETDGSLSGISTEKSELNSSTIECYDDINSNKPEIEYTVEYEVPDSSSFHEMITKDHDADSKENFEILNEPDSTMHLNNNININNNNKDDDGDLGGRQDDEKSSGEGNVDLSIFREDVDVDESLKSCAEEEYPEDKNPFGDEEEDSEKTSKQDDDDSVKQSNNASTNPFGSDLDSADEDENHTQSSKLPSTSLNPFGSDLDSDGNENPNSPSPSLKVTHVAKKKRPAPLPPCQTTPVPAPRLSLRSTSSTSSPRLSKNRAAPDPPGDKAKRLKDVDNLNRRSQIIEGLKKLSTSDVNNKENTAPISVAVNDSKEEEPNKAEEGQWRKKKGPAPPRPLPPKRTVKKLPRKAINQELFDIEVKQGGLERQGVKLEKTIREICAASDAEEGADRDSLGPEAEDLIIQLFDLVNEKNELFRRQTELIYMKKENRLEEMHADCEYQIRVLMSKPECQRTDDDKISEEKLIARLVEIVTQRNEIVDCLEMDRLRELDEDTAIEDHMSDYAAVKPTDIRKKGFIKILKRKKKKKDRDDEKDIDTSEVKDDFDEKPKKKSAKKKLINLASKKLSFPHRK